MRRLALLSAALVAAIAVSGCATPAPAPTPAEPADAGTSPPPPAPEDAGAPAPEPPKPAALCDLAPVLFASSSSTLDVASQAQVALVAACLLKDAEPVTLEGYADGSGSSAYNLALSQKRAESVKASLVEFGVAAGRIAAVGKGEVGADDAADSRRVEFKR